MKQYTMTKKVFQISGNESEAHLMLHTDSGKIAFRQYFETHGMEYLTESQPNLLVKKVSEFLKVELFFCPDFSSQEFDEYVVLKRLDNFELQYFCNLRPL